ncbi:hypothetical protein V8C37DRAFT_377322 [Trichoderma ceciliae]
MTLVYLRHTEYQEQRHQVAALLCTCTHKPKGSLASLLSSLRFVSFFFSFLGLCPMTRTRTCAITTRRKPIRSKVSRDNVKRNPKIRGRNSFWPHGAA